MAKKDKWECLKAGVEQALVKYTAIPNRTAEESGALVAYRDVNNAMRELEKTLDKA